MAFSESFFEVSAQLIPVLLLAMVVEDRLQPGEVESPGDRAIRSWTLAFLVVGETLSLSVVAGGIASSKATGSMVSCAMLFAALLIVAAVLQREIQEERPRWERRLHLLAGMFVIIVILWTLAAVELS
jgi:small-conductance mechanosensitive channel